MRIFHDLKFVHAHTQHTHRGLLVRIAEVSLLISKVHLSSYITSKSARLSFQIPDNFENLVLYDDAAAWASAFGNRCGRVSFTQRTSPDKATWQLHCMVWSLHQRLMKGVNEQKLFACETQIFYLTMKSIRARRHSFSRAHSNMRTKQSGSWRSNFLDSAPSVICWVFRNIDSRRTQQLESFSEEALS